MLDTAGIDTTADTTQPQYAETGGNCEQRNRLRLAVFATYGNTWKQVSADCGSREGRGFEPRRSPSTFRIGKLKTWKMKGPPSR
jgi:hypothetical protein